MHYLKVVRLPYGITAPFSQRPNGRRLENHYTTSQRVKLGGCPADLGRHEIVNAISVYYSSTVRGQVCRTISHLEGGLHLLSKLGCGQKLVADARYFAKKASPSPIPAHTSTLPHRTRIVAKIATSKFVILPKRWIILQIP